MSKPVVYDFFADWCGPCKMQDPILEEVVSKFGDRIEFRKVNVDDEPLLASKYDVKAVPTLVIEKDGRIVHRYVGVTRKSVLEENISILL